MRSKTLQLVTTSEYRRRMSQRGFLIAVLGLPLLILVGIALSAFLSIRQEEVRGKLGYVDNAAVLASIASLPSTENWPEFVALNSEEEARQAVLDGEVTAAFIVAPDYLASRQVTVFSKESLPEEARDSFERYLRWSLVSDLPSDVARRAVNGTDLIVRSLDGKKEFSDSTWPNVVIPFVAAILFFLIIVSNANYALHAVVEEKESRTMEILVTSVSPNELMAGKILAILGMGLTQMLIWFIVLGIGLFFAKRQIAELASFRLDWGFVALALAVFLPAYVLVTSLLAAMGAISSEMREGQQLATMVTLPIFIPLWAASFLISNPNGVVSVILTLFPITAPLTLSIRWAFGTVPTWQMALSILLVIGSALGAIYFAARVFHAGMLRYGRRLTLAEVRQALAIRS